VHRFLIRERDGEFVAGCQVLCKKPVPFFNFTWIPGGPFPVGANPLTAELFQVLLEQLKKRCHLNYLRLYLMRPTEDKLVKILSEEMKRPKVLLNSGRSVLIKLNITDGEFLENMTGKHRYYVRQAQKTPIQWKSEKTSELIRDFCLLMAEMGRIKKKSSLALSVTTLQRLVSLCSSEIRMLVGYFSNRPVAGAMLLGQESKVWYLHAASNEEGRKLGTAYAMIAEIARRLRKENFQEMDFGGLGPDTPAFRGTNHFKNGFGGKIVNYVGEWESGNPLARFVGNLAILTRK